MKGKQGGHSRCEGKHALDIFGSNEVVGARGGILAHIGVGACALVVDEIKQGQQDAHVCTFFVGEHKGVCSHLQITKESDILMPGVFAHKRPVEWH